MLPLIILYLQNGIKYSETFFKNAVLGVYLTKETEVDLRWIGLSWAKGKRHGSIPKRRNSTVVEMPKARRGRWSVRNVKWPLWLEPREQEGTCYETGLTVR